MRSLVGSQSGDHSIISTLADAIPAPSLFGSIVFLAVDREPVDAVHMVPSFLSGGADCLDGGSAQVRRVAILLSHLEPASTVNLIGRDMASEQADLRITRLPT